MLVPKLITTHKDYSQAHFVTDLGMGTIDEALARASALPPFSNAATFPP